MIIFDVKLRKASEQEWFPYKGRLVTFIKIDLENGMISQANTEKQKKEMLFEVTDDDIVLAAWPGQWSQDVFLLDTIEQAKRDLGVL
jgi:hypothetical protein